MSWQTVRTALRGDGNIASLDAVRHATGLRWSWTGNDGTSASRDLAALRSRKRISQRAMARRLAISPQTIVTLETLFRGRSRTLATYLRVLGRHELLVMPGGGKRLVPGPNGHEADLVFTPRALAAEIIADLGRHLQGDVLEPARGDGAFFDAFPDRVTPHWCELAEGSDFFAWTQRVDWIVTNPPFSRFRDFLVHAMKVTAAATHGLFRA
ncbi:MAG: hypothetical protein Q4G49_13720 [Paracoccus sp. (in: a-proteobacteria)]|nr:hypothetical protein [Paracoccus sp. (in: a-proteobacteria)]